MEILSITLTVRKGDADLIQANVTARHAHLEFGNAAFGNVGFVLPFGRTPEETATAIAFLRTLEQRAGELVGLMERHVAELTCGKCGKAFDGGQVVQYPRRPFCRECVSDCHDGGGDHRCVVCCPEAYGAVPA